VAYQEFPKYINGARFTSNDREVFADLIVNSADEEQAVKDGTAIVRTVLSAQGPEYKVIGVKAPVKATEPVKAYEVESKRGKR